MCFSKIFSFAAVAALVLFAANWSRAADAPGPNAVAPNIVVIVPDDLGWNDIGYHDSDIATPHIDRLAAGGVRLEHHYVCPTCSPTRIAILSGRNPSRYGVHGPIGGKSTQHLPLETVTLPKALSQAGYSTHISGKWHLGLQTQYGPTKYGFDTSYGYLHGQIDPYNHLYKFGDRTWHRNDKLFEEDGHATDLITAEAVRIIRQPHEAPYFLYVAYSVPHFPLKEPDLWLDAYDGRIKDPWRKLFAASVSHMDDGIGRIAAAIDESKQRDNTLIVFVSDNGGQRNWNNPGNQYEGRYEPHTTLGDNRPLRGWKGQTYEGGVRVPAFANWPARLPQGAVVQSPTGALDWMPTICALAGIDPPAELKLEGVDIWPQLASGAASPDRTFYWNTGRELAVRTGDWKLIADRDLERQELYNIAADPLEKSDRAEDSPEILARLKAELVRQRAEDGMR